MEEKTLKLSDYFHDTSMNSLVCKMLGNGEMSICVSWIPEIFSFPSQRQTDAGYIKILLKPINRLSKQLFAIDLLNKETTIKHLDIDDEILDNFLTFNIQWLKYHFLLWCFVNLWLLELQNKTTHYKCFSTFVDQKLKLQCLMKLTVSYSLRSDCNIIIKIIQNQKQRNN